MEPQLNVRFYHNVYDKYSFGIQYSHNYTCVAFAFCSPKDQFCRKTARSIINGRISSGIGIYTIDRGFAPPERKNLFHAIRDLANKANKQSYRTSYIANLITSIETNIPKDNG